MQILDRYSQSNKFFDIKNGRVVDKILGPKFLEGRMHSTESKKKTYKEVGELSLMICGYFSQSLNKKIVDISYYQQLGVSAFISLDTLIPKEFEIPSFYKKFSKHFESISNFMTILSSESLESSVGLSEKSFIVLDTCQKKVSNIRRPFLHLRLLIFIFFNYSKIGLKNIIVLFFSCSSLSLKIFAPQVSFLWT